MSSSPGPPIDPDAASTASHPVNADYAQNGSISTFKGFEIIVIGGLGSILGSIVGGALLGVIEVLGSVFVSAAYKDLYGFLVLRPTGLFGERERTA